jgi:hypothetical protein
MLASADYLASHLCNYFSSKGTGELVSKAPGL